jgi:hypothetical protein
MHRSNFYLVPAFRQKQIDGLIRQIVEASLPLARRRISTEANTMSADELRGYVRARVHVAVGDQSRRFSAAYHLEDSFAEQLLERALERIVNLLLRELTEQPPLVLPMYEAPRRAAA